MKKIVSLIVPLLLVFDAFAQVLRRPVAAPYTGMGAYSAAHTDVFSFLVNQAALAEIKNRAAGVYAERRFLLHELSHYTFVLAVPTSSGNFGVKAHYAGFAYYNETQLGLAYGRKLGEKISAGTQVNFNSIRTGSDYGKASAITFEAGAILQLSERLHSGFHINNPVGGKFGKERQEKLASVFSWGLGFTASKKLLVSLVIEKEEDRAVNINGGFQYRVVPSMMIRAGLSSATGTGWIGAGVSLRSFRVDISASYHPELGITPGLLLLFTLGNNQP